MNSAKTGTAQKEIQDIFKRLQNYKKAYIDNSKEIKDLEDKIGDNERKITDLLKEEFDERLQLSEDYISNQEKLNWNSGDSEVAARRRILEWMQSDYYKSLIKDNDEYYKILLENLDNYNKAVEGELNNSISAIERYYDDMSKMYDEENKNYDRRITKENALIDLKTKSFDITNKLAEAQHEADKAIADSRISKQYLSADEYKLIYNEEDYDKISGKINDIYSQAASLTRNFQNQILNAYENEQDYLIESITAEYERQLEMKERELEIAQAEVDLVKKKQQLENVLAEKNVRQIVEKDGRLQWEWVADTDKVRQATEEYSDAQYQVDKLETENKQQAILNSMQQNVDIWERSKSANEAALESLNEAIDKVKQQVEDINNPILTLGTAIDNLEQRGVASLSQAVNDMLDVFENFTSKSYEKVTVPNGKVVQANSDGKAPKGLSAGTLVTTNGGNYLITDVNSDGSYKSVRTHYAKGTKGAAKGLAEVNENGEETYFTKDGVFHNFSGGEMVFTANQTRRLYEIANQYRTNYVTNPDWTNKLDTLGLLQNISNNTNSHNTYGDTHITINNPADFNEFTRKLTEAFRRKNV